MVRMIILFAALAAAPAAAETLAIRGATVIDVRNGRDIADATVLVRNGRIVSVNRRARVPRGARVIDGRGKFLIPGLIDGHVHFFQSGGIHTRPDALDLRSEVPYAQEVAAIRRRLPDTFGRYAKAGVTGAVDMGGPLWNFAVRQSAAERRDAPHVWIAGPLMSPFQPAELVTEDPPILKTPSAEVARTQAQAQLARRPDFLKYWYIVGNDGPAPARPQLTAIMAEGRRQGVRVAVHATELETARAAVAEGADVLVHSVDDKEVDDAFVEAVRKRGTIYIPTMIVMGRYGDVFAGRNPLSALERQEGHPDITAPFTRVDKSKLPSWGGQAAQQIAGKLPILQRNLMRMYRAGVPIVMGTDAGNIGTLHASSVPAEMEAMAAAGMPARAVLASATIAAARMVGRDRDLGSVEPGKIADMVLLREDPRVRIGAVASIDTVVRGGSVVEAAPAAASASASEAVVQKQLEAYNAHDLDAFAGTYSDDVALYMLGPTEKPAMSRGIAQLRKEYEPLFARVKPNAKVLARMVMGPFVVDHELATFGREVVNAAAVYRVENGRISEVWFAEGKDPQAADAAVVDRARKAAADRDASAYRALYSPTHELRMLASPSAVKGVPPLPAAGIAAAPAKRMQIGSFVIDHDRSPEERITIRLVKDGRIERTWIATPAGQSTQSSPISR